MVKIAVVDTCALFSASLRDVLLLAAEVKIYDIRLTDEILEELRRNLINKRKISEKQAYNLIVTIQRAFKDRFVHDYQQFIDLMPVNKKRSPCPGCCRSLSSSSYRNSQPQRFPLTFACSL